MNTVIEDIVQRFYNDLLIAKV